MMKTDSMEYTAAMSLLDDCTRQPGGLCSLTAWKLPLPPASSTFRRRSVNDGETDIANRKTLEIGLG